MSKQNRNAEKKPLMYIVQADYSDTQSSMQDILIKKKESASAAGRRADAWKAGGRMSNSA
ncbi:CotO family spore coat protein [Bacillus velezensis]